VRTRIIGLAVAVSVVAIALFGVPLGVAVYQYAMQAERTELRQVADAVAVAVSNDVLEDDDIDHPEYIGAYGSVKVTVYNRHGEWVGGVPSAGDPELTDALEGRAGAATRKDHFVVAVPVTHSEEVVGAVEATASRNVILPSVVPVWSAMAALAVLAVAAAWLVGRWQARRLALPLEDLAVAAHRLGEGDFSVRTRSGRIPEIDAVGSALDSTAARLDDLLEQERAFSADASHQLRTPLAGLRLRLEAALESPDADPRPAIAASLRDADRLEATIEELLALARDQRSARVDLRALLDELATEWRGRLMLQNRSLHVAIDRGTPDPYASSAAIRQVLAVLVDNASRHGVGAVSLRAREGSGAVAIDVADEGEGVRDSAESLFVQRADRRDGHGIGLALARRLAEAEQGRLTLTQASPPVFTLLLPAAGDGAEADPPPVEAVPTGGDDQRDWSRASGGGASSSR
jgi:signal transduction histidine kinase